MIDWQTVDTILSQVQDKIKPNLSKRLYNYEFRNINNLINMRYMTYSNYKVN